MSGLLSTHLQFIGIEKLLDFLFVVIGNEACAVFRFFKIQNLSCSPTLENGFEHLESLAF